MTAPSTLLTQFILPLAVLVSAAATTATATFAWKLYTSVEVHERALFGEERVDGHDGLVTAVNENTERSEVNRRVLRANDLVAGTDDFYRGDGRPEDGDEQAAT